MPVSARVERKGWVGRLAAALSDEVFNQYQHMGQRFRQRVSSETISSRAALCSSRWACSGRLQQSLVSAASPATSSSSVRISVQVFSALFAQCAGYIGGELGRRATESKSRR
jgi:hypothetical protein